MTMCIVMDKLNRAVSSIVAAEVTPLVIDAVDAACARDVLPAFWPSC